MNSISCSLMSTFFTLRILVSMYLKKNRFSYQVLSSLTTAFLAVDHTTWTIYPGLHHIEH